MRLFQPWTIVTMSLVEDLRVTAIIVSHDRFLVEACADRLWLVGGGRVKPCSAR